MEILQGADGNAVRNEAIWLMTNSLVSETPSYTENRQVTAVRG